GSCRENPKSRDICTPALGFRAQGRRNGTACTHTLVRAHGHAGPGPCGRCARRGHSTHHCGLDGPCKITAHPPACAPLPPPPTESAQAYLLNAPIPALRGLTSIMRTPLLGTLANKAVGISCSQRRRRLHRAWAAVSNQAKGSSKRARNVSSRTTYTVRVSGTNTAQRRTDKTAT